MLRSTSAAALVAAWTLGSAADPTGGSRPLAPAAAVAAAASVALPEEPAEALPSVAAPLPLVEPDPAIAPVIDGTETAIAHPVPPKNRPMAVVRTILALLALAALAYAAGLPRVQRLEEVLGISQVITAGFPFIILGLVARQPAIGILTDDVLRQISPLLRLGLGWLGFVIGFRFNARAFIGLPTGSARLVALVTSVPFAFVLAATGGLLLVSTGIGREAFADPVFVRDALILGTAGAMAAATTTRALPPSPSSERLALVVRLEELAGIIGLAIVAAYFRPTGTEVSWQLPGAAWIFVTIGLGATVAIVVYAVIQRATTGPEFAVMTLGSVSFAAGIAGYLHLSSVVVAFVAGAMLANAPGRHKIRLEETLQRLERPIYLVSLIVIGALWNIFDWRGWVLVPVFVTARLAGKWMATRIWNAASDFDLSVAERNALVFAPIGSLAIAIVVNAQLLYPGGSISLIVSAVIGGAIVTEIVIQLIGRRRAAASVVPETGS